MRGRFGDDGDGEGGDAQAVKDDGSVVEVFEDLDTKGVDEAVGDEDCGVDADDLGGAGCVAGFDGGEGANEAGAAEGDAGGNGH